MKIAHKNSQKTSRMTKALEELLKNLKSLKLPKGIQNCKKKYRCILKKVEKSLKLSKKHNFYSFTLYAELNARIKYIRALISLFYKE